MNNGGINRRSFLAGAAVAGGLGGLALSAKAEVAQNAAASPTGSDTLRWGIIGTGTRGAYTHIPVLKHAPESRVVALCDVDEGRLETAAKMIDHPVEKSTEYQKLLDNKEINAVVIAVPNLLHPQVLAATLAAGKHVLCEKPAGVNMTDAQAMKKSVESAKTLVMFGMQYRNNLRQKAVMDVVASGKIGKPKYMVQTCSRGDWNLSPNVWRYSDPKVLDGKLVNWRFSHAACGGTLNEFSCHYFDLLHGMAGALPTRISCDGGTAVYKDGRNTWDYASMTLTYPDGLTAVHTLSLFGPGRADVTVMGEHGFIESVGDKITLTTKTGEKGGQKKQEIKPDEPEAHMGDYATLGLYKDFLECVKTGKAPIANIDRAIAASRTCWLGELSAQRHAEVSWDEAMA